MFGKGTLFFCLAHHTFPFFCFRILNSLLFRYFF